MEHPDPRRRVLQASTERDPAGQTPGSARYKLPPVLLQSELDSRQKYIEKPPTQKRTVQSEPAVAILVPSGVNRTQSTRPEWLRSVNAGLAGQSLALSTVQYQARALRPLRRAASR